MVKSVVIAEVEPGYEDNVFTRLSEESQVLEAHLTSYENEVIIFLDSRNESQAEAFVEDLRFLRFIRGTVHSYITNEAKSGFTRLNGNKRMAFILSNLAAGAEESTLKALAEIKNVRDVLSLTGPDSVLVTAPVKSIEDMWAASVDMSRTVRFVEGSSTYISSRSWTRE